MDEITVCAVAGLVELDHIAFPGFNPRQGTKSRKKNFN
jgi:hypothetical protein